MAPLMVWHQQALSPLSGDVEMPAVGWRASGAAGNSYVTVIGGLRTGAA